MRKWIKFIIWLLPADDLVKRKPVIDLAREKLGWKPSIILEQGLGKTIDYFHYLQIDKKM